MTILKAMKSSKSEDSVLASHSSERATCENSEKLSAGQLTHTYESATFSSPVLDQFGGLLPDFNNRLSPERDLGLSSHMPSRLSQEPLPRLVSDSALGLVSGSLTSPLSGLELEKPEMSAGIGHGIKPDLAGRTLAGDKIGLLTLSADLPLGPVGSRMLTLMPAEDETKKK